MGHYEGIHCGDRDTNRQGVENGEQARWLST